MSPDDELVAQLDHAPLDRSSSSMPIVVADLDDDRPHVEQRVLERNQHEPRDAVAGGGARPVVERKLKVRESGAPSRTYSAALVAMLPVL